MEYILLFTIFVLTAVCIQSRVLKRTPLTIFCTLWLIILFLYFLRFGLYDCSENTYLVYLIGIISFFIGSVLVKPVNRSKIKVIKRRDIFYKAKYFILLFFSVISFIILVKKSILALPLWLMGEGEGGEIKSAIVQNELSTGTLDDMIYGFIGRPMQIIMVIYAVIIVFEKKKDYLVIMCAILLTIAGYVCSASKFSVAQILTVVLAYAFLYGRMSFKQTLKRYKTLWISFLGIFVFIAFMMSLRDEGMWEGFYIYMCGCVPMSDQALQTIDNSSPAYGMVSFNGIVRVVNIIPSYVLGWGNEFKKVIDYYFDYMFQFEDATYIGKNTRYNAFVSIFSYFYADGKYIGVALLSALFGWCCSKSYFYSLRRPSISSYSLVLLLIIFISQSMVRIKTFYAPDTMALLIILFLFPRNSLDGFSHKVNGIH